MAKLKIQQNYPNKGMDMKPIFRLQWIAVALVVSLISAQGYSQWHSYDVSESELQGLISTLSDEVSTLDTLDSVTEINQHLNSFQSLEQTVLTHLWLKQLSYRQEISEHYLIWVRSLVSSNAMLSDQHSEHPQKQIALVNIAQQARSVLKINKIKHLVEKIKQQWLSGEFIWSDWLTSDPDNYAALVNWLTVQDKDIDAIKHSFVENSTSEQWPNNQILAILIGKSPSRDLFSLLWQRKVDEFTYQTIHLLPNRYEGQLVITQLVEAMKIKQLTSQALLSLATHYPLDETSQNTIEASLAKPDQQWYALMALDKMNAPEFKKSLLIKFEQRQSRFTESATKIIESQIAEAESKVRR